MKAEVFSHPGFYISVCMDCVCVFKHAKKSREDIYG